MPFQVGIIALLHESNTFIGQATTFDHFSRDLLATSEDVRAKLGNSLHEVGGFFQGLLAEKIEAVPLFAARALPFGIIETSAADELLRRLIETIEQAGPLDGYLVSPHGAAVAEAFPDFDGQWLSQLRMRVGQNVPIIGTLDLHANLSARMVSNCTALIAYRTNPHLDQRERGFEAAQLMAQTLRGEVRPTMAAAFPPLIVNIERQATAEPHWQPLLQYQREQKGILSSSLVYGFPYSDVAEMGSSVIVVTDNDKELAQTRANELADEWWRGRDDFIGLLNDPADVMNEIQSQEGPIGLMDMGDNVGGGSPADGTFLAMELHRRRMGPSLVVLFDPDAVERLKSIPIGEKLTLSLGGHTDNRHGEPLVTSVKLVSRCHGQFEESEVRHGGIRWFDQGPTTVVKTDSSLTVVLTSRRMAPFSLNQLYSCGLDPASFRFIVIKGVHAPVAAYRSICRKLIRVNTAGSTTADMQSLTYSHRRRPLFPFEQFS